MTQLVRKEGIWALELKSSQSWFPYEQIEENKMHLVRVAEITDNLYKALSRCSING